MNTKISELLKANKSTSLNINPLKVALFLEDREDSGAYCFIQKKSFYKFIKPILAEKIDLFVFPENCITPITYITSTYDIESPTGYESLLAQCRPLAQKMGCPIIYSGINYQSIVFSVYVNPFAENDETKDCLYIKHTATETSAFDLGYTERLSSAFPVIKLKGYRLGMTICYDCNHSLFSRAYGKQGVDILINSTGGNVVRTKWYRYTKVRALENHCFSLCTMGFEEGLRNKSFTFAFTPAGASIEWTKCIGDDNNSDSPNHIYIYNVDPNYVGEETDISLFQGTSISKHVDWKIAPQQLNSILATAMQIEDGVYILPVKCHYLVFVIVHNGDIMKPELLCQKLYNPELLAYENKKYLLVNIWDRLDESYFKTTLSDVLKARAAENYIAVLMISPIMNKCFQPGYTKNVQDIRVASDGFGLDFKRMGGPEVLWKGKPKWRDGYKLLNDYLVK